LACDRDGIVARAVVDQKDLVDASRRNVAHRPPERRRRVVRRHHRHHPRPGSPHAGGRARWLIAARGHAAALGRGNVHGEPIALNSEAPQVDPPTARRLGSRHAESDRTDGGNHPPGVHARRVGAMTARARTSLIACGVALLTAAVFLPAVENGFIDLDDEYNFLENTLYRGFAPAQLHWMFHTFHLGPWQPLSWLSLAVDHALWGLNPAGYHLTNLVLHAASAALLFVLARRLLLRAGLSEVAAESGAAVGALLWAIHPLRVESV